MKLLSSLTLTFLTSSMIYAQTTMCFKENHNSMSTIESVKLEGGECKSKFTLNDMKEKGYTINDIKITTLNNGKYNFIYILKKSNSTSLQSNIFSEKQLEKRILQRIEEKKAKEKKEQEEKLALQLIEDGKKIYTNKCQSCHGIKGEKTPYNVGNSLKDLSEDEIANLISNYSNDSSYGYGYGLIMRPIADSITKESVSKIKAYLDSINK